jgi:hypothetical protein
MQAQVRKAQEALDESLQRQDGSSQSAWLDFMHVHPSRLQFCRSPPWDSSVTYLDLLRVENAVLHAEVLRKLLSVQSEIDCAMRDLMNLIV